MARPSVKTIRTEIGAETVKQAIKLSKSAASSADLQDWFDTKLRYLQLRQRGRTVKWYCRAKGKSILLGSAINELGSGYLSVASAREQAMKIYVNGKPSSGTAVTPEPPSWTWSEVDSAYQASLKEFRVTKSGREKHPRLDSQKDVRGSLAKPSIAKWAPLSVNKLNPNMVEDAIGEIHRENGHRAACKALTYVKAALNFATQMRRQSGISYTSAWWADIFPPMRTEKERDQANADEIKLLNDKSYYSVDHLGELLVAHEEYCASRDGLSRVSPGVRWGTWWVAFTANRRRSPTVLQRSELFTKDVLGKPGWGIAKWADSEMKGQNEFWLPLPPVVLHVATSSIEEWEAIVNRSASTHKATTAWVFSSTRRIGRNPDTVDVVVNGSSLSHHVEDLRAWDKFPKQTAEREDGTNTEVNFTLHVARSIVGNWLDKNERMPASASSLILAHAGKNDGATDKVAKTTKQFYLTGQKMDVKAIAMEAWSDAVMNAYIKAGGAPPMPRKHEFKRRRPSPKGQITNPSP